MKIIPLRVPPVKEASLGSVGEKIVGGLASSMIPHHIWDYEAVYEPAVEVSFVHEAAAPLP